MSSGADVAKPPASPKQPLVSVVTPVYNTAAFLAQAIESVLAQTHGHFEYILSDNCSTDGSLEIARRYAEADPRIRLIEHGDFIAQIPNYNRALGYISENSAYCKIVQADDWIYPECLERMLSLALRHPSVAIVGCCYLASNRIGGHGLPFDRDVFAGPEACQVSLLQGGTYFGSPTCLLYRSDVVRRRQPFLEVGEVNADTTACFEILREGDFARVPQILAFLRRGNASTWERLQAMGGDSFLKYALVERYGPQLLEPHDLERRRHETREIYLREVARLAVTRSAPPFWRFHRERLATLGQPLPQCRIAWLVVDFLLDKVLNPRRTWQGILERRRMRRRSP